MDTECVRKRGVKDACEVWGLTAGKVGLPSNETGKPSLEHIWGEMGALSCGRVKFEISTDT